MQLFVASLTLKPPNVSKLVYPRNWNTKTVHIIGMYIYHICVCIYIEYILNLCSLS
jgi:hypothetical protein